MITLVYRIALLGMFKTLAFVLSKKTPNAG
jgi:hypothetical protein